MLGVGARSFKNLLFLKIFDKKQSLSQNIHYLCRAIVTN
jgi:hypothetical protein